MTDTKISSGTVHMMPADVRKALASDPSARAKWNDLTPLARNEWICWIGCVHRTDKSVSPSQKFVLGRRSKK